MEHYATPDHVYSGVSLKHPHLQKGFFLLSFAHLMQLIVAIPVLLSMALSTTLVLAGTSKLWLHVTQDWHCLELLWLCVVMEEPGSQTQLTSNAYSTPQLVRMCLHNCTHKRDDIAASKFVHFFESHFQVCSLE